MNRSSAAGLSLILGFTLIALGAPRILATLVALPGDRILEEIAAGRRVEGQSLDTLISSRRSVLAVVSSARAENDLGLALLLRARLSKPDDRYRLLTDAIAALRASLANAPASPYGWTRLAEAMIIRDGGSPATAAVLNMAIVSSPDDGPVSERLRLCLATLPYFSPDQRALVGEQLRMAWSRYRNETLASVVRLNAQDELRKALKDDARGIAELDRLKIF